MKRIMMLVISCILFVGACEKTCDKIEGQRYNREKKQWESLDKKDTQKEAKKDTTKK